MWVRGLKHGNSAKYNEHNKSHPMWVRGLKPRATIPSISTMGGAPYVGAWIGTRPC